MLWTRTRTSACDEQLVCSLSLSLSVSLARALTLSLAPSSLLRSLSAILPQVSQRRETRTKKNSHLDITDAFSLDCVGRRGHNLRNARLDGQ
jgi:hypothetical protein